MTDHLELDEDRFLILASLLSAATAQQLKAMWLDLTEADRRALRPSRALAHHAWSLLIRDRILTGAAA